MHASTQQKEQKKGAARLSPANLERFMALNLGTMRTNPITTDPIYRTGFKMLES